jgi:hypothetical protein
MPPLTDFDIRQIVQDELKKSQVANLYGVSPIPAHTQSGTDSQQVDPNSLLNSTLYFAVKQTVLSSSQILALKDTPVTLLPAIGQNLTSATSLNTALIVHGISAKIYAGAVAYTGANALEFRYTNASGAKVTADIPNTFINTTASTTAWAHAAGIITAFTPVPAKPIVVCVPTANPATGNGRIIISVYYRAVSL